MKNQTTNPEKGHRLLQTRQLVTILCLGACGTFLSHSAAATGEPLADKKPNFTIANVTDSSDWYVKLKVVDDPNADMNCWGTDTYSYTIYKNGVAFSTRSGTLSKNQVVLAGITIDNPGGKWSITYKTHGSAFNCHYWKDSNEVPASTTKLRAPASAVASDSLSEEALQNVIKLTWTKGTDVPNAYHHYWIFRDGDFSAPVKAVPGTDPLVWVDTDVNQGETHTYSIITRVSSSAYGHHVSDTVTATGSTLPVLNASDGVYQNSVEITWSEMSNLVTSLKIYRDGTEIEGRDVSEENPETRLFKDTDRVPGLKHTYSLIPYHGTAPYVALTDHGYARRNGRITGSVKAPFGGPVQGAVVYAERITSVLQGDENPAVYADTTDANGLFDIRGIYYHTDADFKVYVVKGDHEFNPASYDQISLDLTAPSYALPSPSFIDISSFTILGQVTQQFVGDIVAVENVEILVNGLFKGTKTDSDGNFALTVEELGEYTISPRFSTHAFVPAETTIEVQDNVSGLDFVDTEMDTLSGSFTGGCNIYFGRASLRIFSTRNPTAGIDTTIWTNEGSGVYEIVLPSREYTVEVVDFIADASAAATRDEVIDFFGVSEVDLTHGSVTRDYVYRRPPEVQIIGFPDAGCEPFNVPIMEQLVKYPLEIRVFESFGNESCLTSTGFLLVYDEIKDGYDGADTIFLDSGIGKYHIVAGAPNIIGGGSHPYQKKILIHAHVDGQTTEVEQYVLVEGNRPREQTFATVTPEVPFMILRDPPGDESYSYLSENTKFTSSMSFYSQLSGSVNVWDATKLGLEQEAGVGVIIPFKLWGEIKSTLEVGASLKTQLELGMEFAVENKFTTSGNQRITGSDGDVFVGSAMNMLYALTDVIEFDADACDVVTSQEIIMAPDGFATTFMYTENHIEEVLIPQLDDIRRLYEQKGSDSTAFYANQISVWRQTLQANADLKESAIFIENRSFSAGAGFESSATLTTSAKLSLEYSLYLEESLALEAGLEVAGSGKSIGAEVKYRMEVGGSASAGVQHEKTVGYYLNDDDLGDFFSVDIKGDPAYATPVFSLVSGRSSCPWEPGTQPREGIQLTTNKHAQYDIPEDGQATFKLNLGNTSQSDEDQVYNLVFLQESNPEGAVLTLGGSQVQGGIMTPYNIPAGNSVEVTVTVKKGPNATVYQDLMFALLSGCDDGIIGDTVSFSVYFQGNCSPIAISKPFNNWTVNSGDNNGLQVELSGYDKSKLNNIVLQHRNLASSVWETSTILSVEELPADKTSIVWDVTAVDDGDYALRAKVACGEDNSEYNFSETITGEIDRTAPSLAGVPHPADGTYSDGDEVSATFDESLNCFALAPENVTFKEKASGMIYPVGLGCLGNKLLIVPLTEASFQDKVIEITLAGLEDTNGNVRQDDIIWEFDIVSADFAIEADTDSDEDRIPDNDDNCPYTPNEAQEDADGDGIGDVCDTDIDGDGVANNMDNCPYMANAGQADSDGDGIGDVCSDDVDLDGVGNEEDNCPSTFNPLQEDEDGDGIGDICRVVTGLGDEINGARAVQCYPNPASAQVNVVFEMERDGGVTIAIFDLTNRLVKTLVDEAAPRGKYDRAFNVRDLREGLYIVLTSKDGRTEATRLLIRN